MSVHDANPLALSCIVVPCCRKTINTIEGMAQTSGHRFNYLDRLYLALGWGYGHGACHVVFFFASLLPLTTGNGTYYTDTCPHMSIFLISALNSLGFGATLAALMVISMDGWLSRSPLLIAYAPVMHLLSGLVVSRAKGFV